MKKQGKREREDRVARDGWRRRGRVGVLLQKSGLAGYKLPVIESSWRRSRVKVADGQPNSCDALLASPRAWCRRDLLSYTLSSARSVLVGVVDCNGIPGRPYMLILTINCRRKSVPVHLSQSREMTRRYNPLGVLHTSRYTSYTSQPSISLCLCLFLRPWDETWEWSPPSPVHGAQGNVKALQRQDSIGFNQIVPKRWCGQAHLISTRIHGRATERGCLLSRPISSSGVLVVKRKGTQCASARKSKTQSVIRYSETCVYDKVNYGTAN